MTIRNLLLITATASATAAIVAAPLPASADPVCVEAQASGLFLVEHVGPVCAATPFSTTTQTETVTVGVETVKVTYTL